MSDANAKLGCRGQVPAARQSIRAATMKACPTVALAFVGWVLMYPEHQTHSAYVNERFKTAKECRAELLKELDNADGITTLGDIEPDWLPTIKEAKCVPSNDPRLKSK
jgi:hypothetical protein